MDHPNNHAARIESNRSGVRKFYRYSLIAYWPLLFVFGYIFDIISNGAFLDFNLWQSLLFALLFTLPLYLCYVAIGQLVLYLISDKSASLPKDKYKKGLILRIVGIALTVGLIIVIGILLY